MDLVRSVAQLRKFAVRIVALFPAATLDSAQALDGLTERRPVEDFELGDVEALQVPGAPGIAFPAALAVHTQCGSAYR